MNELMVMLLISLFAGGGVFAFALLFLDGIVAMLGALILWLRS